MDAAEILASLFALFWWIVLIISFEKDRSRYRNCYFLFFALISTVVAVTMFADGHGAFWKKFFARYTMKMEEDKKKLLERLLDPAIRPWWH